MNNQYLQFVREQLMIATADLSGSTKCQLEAWQENALFDTGRYRRKKIRYRDEVTGKMITRDNPPIQGKQSLAKGSSIALVSPVEFATSSWRRAVLETGRTSEGVVVVVLWRKHLLGASDRDNAVGVE